MEGKERKGKERKGHWKEQQQKTVSKSAFHPGALSFYVVSDKVLLRFGEAPASPAAPPGGASE